MRYLGSSQKHTGSHSIRTYKEPAASSGSYEVSCRSKQEVPHEIFGKKKWAPYLYLYFFPQMFPERRGLMIMIWMCCAANITEAMTQWQSITSETSGIFWRYKKPPWNRHWFQRNYVIRKKDILIWLSLFGSISSLPLKQMKLLPRSLRSFQREWERHQALQEISPLPSQANQTYL